MSGIFKTFFYQPLYNGLIFLIAGVPWIDAGVAVIIFTSLIKLILFPLSKQSVKTQIQMREIEPELAQIRKQYKDDKTLQAQKTMDLYKNRGIHPFAGFFLVLIQLPIIIALYQVFYHGGFTTIDSAILYPFVHAPEYINTKFLGFFDVTKRSIILAFVAAIAQFVQTKIIMPTAPKSDTPSFQNDLARSMSLQMTYVFPIVIFAISYSVSSAIAIYLTTSSLFTIAQELYLRKKYKKA